MSNTEPVPSIYTPEIGYNLASSLPRILIPREVETLTRKLGEAGYNFVSALPMRNITDREGRISGCQLPIWYLEEAWNPTKSAGLAGMMEVLRGMAIRDPLTPKIYDFIAFPNKETADTRFRQMIERLKLAGSPPTVIVHHLQGIEELKWSLGNGINTVIEVNPGMLNNQGEILTANELLSELAYPASSQVAGVALDTKHIRRAPRSDELAKTQSLPNTPTRTSLGAWEGVVQQFISHTSLMDFQGKDTDEMLKTIEGKNTELRQIIEYIRDAGYRGPVRVEFNLGLANQIKPGVVEDVAKDVYAYLSETMRATQPTL